MERQARSKSPTILSAFTWPSLKGRIYVEARSEHEVFQACTGLLHMRLRNISRIPIDEALALLQLGDQFFSVVPGDWVRIRLGEYRNDLALVLEVDREHVCIALIPRISMSVETVKGKRKLSSLSRPAQQLFDEKKVIEVYGEESVTKCNTFFKFEDQNFRNGLLELDLTLLDLVQERACPTTAELQRFVESLQKFPESPTAQKRFIDLAIARKSAASLRLDDPVVVVSGTMKGTTGKFKAIDGVDQDKVAIEISDDSPGDSYIVHLPIIDVERYFQVGDFVKVKQGLKVGCAGWVVSYNRPHVTFHDMATSREVRIPCYCSTQNSRLTVNLDHRDVNRYGIT